ncbi:MAG: hypothetical protein AABX53_00315 [Nanoarchaeota archaeon]
MALEQGVSTKVIVLLLAVAVLFSVLSVMVSLSVRDSFKSDFVPVRQTGAGLAVGDPSSDVGLQVLPRPGAGS